MRANSSNSSGTEEMNPSRIQIAIGRLKKQCASATAMYVDEIEIGKNLDDWNQ